MRTRAPVAYTCTGPGEEKHTDTRTRTNGRDAVAGRQGIYRSVGVYNMRPRIYKGALGALICAYHVFAHARQMEGRYTLRQQDSRTIEPQSAGWQGTPGLRSGIAGRQAIEP